MLKSGLCIQNYLYPYQQKYLVNVALYVCNTGSYVSNEVSFYNSEKLVY